LYLGLVNNAQEEERKRISHELHDDTIQELVVLSRKLDVMASDDPKLSEECRLQLEGLRKQTNNIMLGIRRLSQDLRPAALDRLGLIPAIEWLAEDITKYSGIPIKVNFKGEECRLSEEKELVLFRIVQEAVRNIAHHSKATQAEIVIECSEYIRITVSDNGQGFKIPEKVDDLQTKGKLGLVGMLERSQLIGATLKIKSEIGKGTIINIEVET
jgi:signal transduction histidine kinase